MLSVLLMLFCSAIVSCGAHPVVEKYHAPVNILKKQIAIENSNLTQLSQSLLKSETNHNYKQAAFYRLKINYLYEKDLNKKLQLKSPITMKKKYKLLKGILKKNIAILSNSQTEENIYQSLNLIYHPLSIREINKVNKKYGYLFISPPKTNNKKTYSQVISKQPWSGHWYPFSQNSIYSGENSPLHKFDKLVNKLGYESSSQKHEEEIHSYFNASSWEGLCDAWSLASVTTPEPQKPLATKEINFTIADLKALITYASLKRSYIQYGITYKGNHETDGTYQDIRPEAFHKIVTSIIGEENRPIIIDDMSGVQVWNKPMFRYRWLIENDTQYKNAVKITGYPWLIKERNKETDKKTSTEDIISPVYYYRLFFDPETKDKDGRFLVIASQWIGSSQKDHPDNVKVPTLNQTIGSHNSEFNKHLDIFKTYILNNLK
jgi:hypothetical protein